MIEKKQSWSESILVYKDIRMLRILLLGAISGFPWVLIASSLSLWLKEEGLSRSTIGWAGLIFGVYAFNYLWAPIIDRIQIPFLTKKLGHRRGWIVLMQVAILLSLIVWSFINPTENLALLISVGLIIAIVGAIGFLISGSFLDADLPLSIGFINIPAFLIFIPITTFMARVGANTIHKVDKTKVQAFFGLFLFVVGTIFIYRFLNL